jgi:hypothetical protein
MNSSVFEIIGKTFDFLFLVLPIVAPIVLAIMLIKMWIAYARRNFLAKQEYKVVQVLPPTIITKSPAAMELFLLNFHQAFGEANWWDKYVKGSSRPWSSLEMVSDGGKVKFYIWARSSSIPSIESQLYANYPGIEVKEVDDYAQVKLDYEKYSVTGAELGLTAPDPYPIKTYVDYGLDRETEEEFKIDPLTPLIELLGSLTPGHQLWIQILIRAHKKEDKDPNKMFGVTDKWIDTAKDEIKKIREEGVIESGSGENKRPVQGQTKGQAMRIEALERSVSKQPFDVGIRFVYFAQKDDFNKGYFGGAIGAFKQFSSLDLNGFKPAIIPGYSYPWQDRKGVKTQKQNEEIFEAFKERGYFWREYPKYGLIGGSVKRKHFVLNTEELATIYHFPSGAVNTPTLGRVQSKKSVPPSNLPI